MTDEERREAALNAALKMDNYSSSNTLLKNAKMIEKWIKNGDSEDVKEDNSKGDEQLLTE